jgi:hypothetical protein
LYGNKDIEELSHLYEEVSTNTKDLYSIMVDHGTPPELERSIARRVKRFEKDCVGSWAEVHPYETQKIAQFLGNGDARKLSCAYANGWSMKQVHGRILKGRSEL